MYTVSQQTYDGITDEQVEIAMEHRVFVRKEKTGAYTLEGTHDALSKAHSAMFFGADEIKPVGIEVQDENGKTVGKGLTFDLEPGTYSIIITEIEDKDENSGADQVPETSVERTSQRRSESATDASAGLASGTGDSTSSVETGETEAPSI